MKRLTNEQHLASVPAAVRRALLEAEHLPRGAAAVVSRLFEAMKLHKDTVDVPSAKSFRKAAASEATFRLLLRVLTAHAPHISTACAKEVSEGWYAARSAKTRSQSKPKAKVEADPRASWPDLWREYGRALDRAPIKETSRQRLIASINRCACLVREGFGSEIPGYLTARDLANRFLQPLDGSKPVKPITAANYIDALISLGRKGERGTSRRSL